LAPIVWVVKTWPTFFAVFFLEVVDDLVAVDVAEIDVDIRHRLALRIEKALEKEVVFDRIGHDDIEAPADQAARARAPAWARRTPWVLAQFT
jgi:hypothetical protein